MSRRTRFKITPSSGNVFRDLGFSREEAEHLSIRSDLMIAVQKALDRPALRQAEAAKIRGATQSRVTDLLRGRTDLYSTDALIDMLARLGIRVRVVLSRRVADCGRPTPALTRAGQRRESDATASGAAHVGRFILRRSSFRPRSP